MADHILVHDPLAISATDAVFNCTACGKPFGFNKPGFGSPTAIPGTGQSFLPPEDWAKYCGPCDKAVTEKTQLEDALDRIAKLEAKVK